MIFPVIVQALQLTVVAGEATGLSPLLGLALTGLHEPAMYLSSFAIFPAIGES
jgi:hypothetical protein